MPATKTAAYVVALLVALTCQWQAGNCRTLTDECPDAVGLNDSHRFHIWILVPDDNQYKFSEAKVRPAVDRAIQDATVQLAKYNVSLTQFLNPPTYEDTKCDPDYVPVVVSDIHDEALIEENCTNTGNTTQEVDVFIGVTCDFASGRVATLASHWKWPVILPGARNANLDEKQDLNCCSTTTRTGITASDAGSHLVNTLKRFDWNITVVVYSYYNSHGAHISYTTNNDCGIMLGGVTLEYNKVNWTRDRQYDVLERNTDRDIEEDVDDILDEISAKARVSIWCVSPRTMRRVMQRAHQRGMTDVTRDAEYVFFYMNYYNTNTSYTWSDIDDSPQYDTSSDTEPYYSEGGLDAPGALDALRALQIITIRTPVTEQYQNFSDDIKAALYSNEETREYNDYVNPFITAYYNAVMTFFNGIIKALCNGEYTFEDGKEFTESLWGIQFETLGSGFSISGRGDEWLDYSILDMNPETNKFEVVLDFFGHNQSFVEYRAVDWPGETPPLNTPECGFSNENCQTDTTDFTLVYALVPCAIVVLVLAAILGGMMRKILRDKRLSRRAWKIQWTEIDFAKSAGRDHTSSESRDSHSFTSSLGGSGSLHSPSATGRQKFAKTGLFKNNLVAVKELNRGSVPLDRPLLEELEMMQHVDHQHICKFLGANDEAPHVVLVTEYCQRGSLQDVLEASSQYELDDVFKNSFICDVVSGMYYIHRSSFQLHGNLKSSNCLVDSRFVVKLADFGLSKFREGAKTNSKTEFKYYESKLWTAPELLRTQQQVGTPKGDVYSFAIIAQEIMFRKGVFYRQEEISTQEILHRVTSPLRGQPPFRPTLDDNDDVILTSSIRDLIKRCWAEHQNERPTTQEINRAVKKLQKQSNLVDSLLERLLNYSQHLEDKVEERTAQYKTEKDRADGLLYQMLPKQVAEKLKKGHAMLPESYESVTIFFSDIVGFTAISHGSTPLQVVGLLNDLYTLFDRVIDTFDVYKVETIGDAYMLVSGLPQRNGINHAREIARVSLSLIHCVKEEFRIKHMPETQLKLRVGMHTGPVVAGVVGLKMPRYCLFGDTVNTSSRMESNGQPLRIHVSPKTKELLDEFETFKLEEREEEVFLKGLGNWKTWWLLGEENEEYKTRHHEKRRLQTADSNASRGSGCNGAIGDAIFVEEDEMRMRRRHKESTKERRSGIMGSIVHAQPDIPSSGFTPESQRKEKILRRLEEQLASQEAEEEEEEDDNPHRKRVVQFTDSTPEEDNSSTSSSKDSELVHGRDSGIGMGYDNPSYIVRLPSDEEEQSDML